MVTRDEVISAFRFILGREPGQADVDAFLGAPDWRHLRQLIMASPFKQAVQQPTYVDILRDSLYAPANVVDVDISSEQFDTLVRHIQRSWEIMGEERPHWSVLTQASFLPENIAVNVDDFYKSGRSNVELMQKAALRSGKVLPSSWTSFELGCGVGRITTHLAACFQNVIAADISRPHLDLAATYLADKSIQNVRLVQLTSLATLEELEPFDIFYSIIVLQHNPPPVIFRILQVILRKVRVGGCVYFQVPVACREYRFSIADYLATIGDRREMMEMHILPQVHLFGLLQDHGFRILDLQRDNSTGANFHSLTIFAERKAD